MFQEQQTGLLRYPKNQENWKKSGNLKIDLKSLGKVSELENWHKNQGKLREFHKIEWLAIASQMNSMRILEVEYAWFGFRIWYIWFFCKFAEIYKLLFNLWKSANCSSDYRWIPRWLKCLIVKFRKTLVCWFWIFGFYDLMVISKNKNVLYHKTNIKFLLNFHEVITYYARKLPILKSMSWEKFIF